MQSCLYRHSKAMCNKRASLQCTAFLVLSTNAAHCCKEPVKTELCRTPLLHNFSQTCSVSVYIKTKNSPDSTLCIDKQHSKGLSRGLKHPFAFFGNDLNPPTLPRRFLLRPYGSLLQGSRGTPLPLHQCRVCPGITNNSPCISQG